MKTRRSSDSHPYSSMLPVMRACQPTDFGLRERRRRFLLNSGWIQHQCLWLHADWPRKEFGLTAATKQACIRWWDIRQLEIMLWVMRDLGIVECSREGPDGKLIRCDDPIGTLQGEDLKLVCEEIGLDPAKFGAP